MKPTWKTLAAAGTSRLRAWRFMFRLQCSGVFFRLCGAGRFRGRDRGQLWLLRRRRLLWRRLLRRLSRPGPGAFVAGPVAPVYVRPPVYLGGPVVIPRRYVVARPYAGIGLIPAITAAAGGNSRPWSVVDGRGKLHRQRQRTTDQCLSFSALWAAIAAPVSAAELRAGAAAVAITPPVGIPMAGYYSERGASGIHDDLFAKAIVIEQGGTTAALVALDLIAAPRDLVEDAARAIERTCRVPGANVMISATHSHTGPIVDTKNRFGGQSELVKTYRASLPAQNRRGRSPGRSATGCRHALLSRRATNPRSPSTAAFT